jgi:hypothetical protein
MDVNYLVVEEMVKISKLFDYTWMLRIGCKPMILITQTWLITCLKVFKASCCRLMYPLPLEAFACLEVLLLGHDGSVLLSVVAQALLCKLFVCRFLSSFRWCRWWLSVGSLGFYVLDSVLKPVAGVELSKEVFTSRARWIPLIVEWNASANMFYLLKNLMLPTLVIFKLKWTNLIFNEIMVLNALYVCLHAFSLRRESLDLDPRRRTPHFWGGSVTTILGRPTTSWIPYKKVAKGSLLLHPTSSQPTLNFLNPSPSP